MVIEIYGKQTCKKCEQAKKKVFFLVQKWEVGHKVEVKFQDMETVSGAADGAFFDVRDIPTTVVREGYDVLGRWDGAHPESESLRTLIAPEIVQEAPAVTTGN